jgi:phospholipase C
MDGDDDFFKLAARYRKAGDFPRFSLIEPKYFGTDQNDDHPPHNIMKGEKLIADTYNALRSNPALWESTLLVVVFDEHGGFYDHVPPPAAVPPAPPKPKDEWVFDRLGVRVPAILVSPWVNRGVEHTPFDHTSLLKYLIEKWALGAPNCLGDRTAAANSIACALAAGPNQPRDDTTAFIRVPFSQLVPDKNELASYESTVNENQASLQLLADFIREELDQAGGGGIDTAASALSREEGMARTLDAFKRLGLD